MAAVAASAAAPVDGLDDGGDQGGGGEEEVHSGSTRHAMRGNIRANIFFLSGYDNPKHLSLGSSLYNI